MGQGTRKSEIHQRRNRRKKLGALRRKFKESKSATEKEKLVTKAGRIAPWLTEQEFVAIAKKSA